MYIVVIVIVMFFFNFNSKIATKSDYWQMNVVFSGFLKEMKTIKYENPFAHSMELFLNIVAVLF